MKNEPNPKTGHRSPTAHTQLTWSPNRNRFRQHRSHLCPQRHAMVPIHRRPPGDFLSRSKRPAKSTCTGWERAGEFELSALPEDLSNSFLSFETIGSLPTLPTGFRVLIMGC